jgi:hypothetical protein
MFCLPDIGQTAHMFLSVPYVSMCAVWLLPPSSATIGYYAIDHLTRLITGRI